MISTLRKYWNENPLMVALLAGGFFRLLAVFFSKGFGMHDDHFLVIEAAQSWVDGYDYDDWFPESGAKTPSGHNFFYPGLHYLLFKFLEFINITDAQVKMYVVRFLHALLSLVTIVYAYRITQHYSDKKQAGMAALLLALLFFMPVLSVRNLAEVVCVPFLLMATWHIIKAEKTQHLKWFFFSGLMAGFAFSFRYQTVFFIGGFGLYLLMHKEWKGTVLFSIGTLLVALTTQGIVDIYNWGYPFAEFMGYLQYNIKYAEAYFTKPWYMYLPLIAGILIPPISIFLCIGYIRTWRKYLLIFLPSFLFLVVHSYFPNKQERFIFPVFPFIIMSGIMGWHAFKNRSGFWQKNTKLYRACWIFFWTVNAAPLCFLSVAYIKKDRVEAMRYLSNKKMNALLIEDRTSDEFIMPVQFYMEQWPQVYGLNNKMDYDSLKTSLKGIPLERFPAYVIFIKDDNLQQRLTDFENQFAGLKFE
ncbi:MAG TPA: glycosyltransferase family 39 protein, partial [Flavobacteriales bacterium]|nr:glycosyltransferase family 39 protein [Flavobacteriales bacterium]